jgi:predicted transcriptional regulator
MDRLLKVLTPNRWDLLRTLRSNGPSSIRALSQALGRDYRGVHADVGILLKAGLIERKASGAIHVPWSRITAEMSLDIAA